MTEETKHKIAFHVHSLTLISTGINRAREILLQFKTFDSNSDTSYSSLPFRAMLDMNLLFYCFE